ncbi:MAG TPA: NAD(P)H-dependent glycerol-3-phosphate dehydrogenase [Spirochaetota bacterium]
MKQITIVGAGAFGSAISIYAHSIGHKVKVWAFEKDLPAMVREKGENEIYLPGVKINPAIHWTTDPDDAVDGADLIVLVCPSAYVRSTSKLIADKIPKNALIVSAAKGIENGTLALMSQVLEETLSAHRDRLTFLSGPSFARDVANGLPTDLACAAFDINTAREVQSILHSPALRIYTNDDVIGTELGGALKNVIAVACGVAAGMNLGGSALASLMTRGLAEITRLGVAMGARPLSFSGLAGVGDLILTCTGDLSRNRTLGKRLAAGEKASDIISSQKAVAEGYVTVKPAIELAAKHGVDMPIAQAVYRVCYENENILEEAKSLMSRTSKDEFAGI